MTTDASAEISAEISADDPFPRKRLTIGETTMAYVDEGLSGGDPIIFLHGNPTSS